MSIVRGVLAWPVLLLGKLVGYPVWKWGWPGYALYNKLCCWSVDIQGEQDFGPWTRVKDDETPR